MASKSKKTLREIAALLPSGLIAEEFFARCEDGRIDIPEDQSDELDEDGKIIIAVTIRDN